MIVYESRRFAARRYQYGGSGSVSTIGSLLARYATKSMLATTAKTALRGSLDAAKGANATDESIKSYEYDEYQLISGTQLSPGQITITIENQDQFLHLHNSCLLIEGDVLKADATRYANAYLIALTNNGLLYLFSSLKLTLAGQEVEHFNYPGQRSLVWGAIHQHIVKDVD